MDGPYSEHVCNYYAICLSSDRPQDVGLEPFQTQFLRVSARNLEAWSYTSIKTTLGMFESSQHSRITTSLAFVLRINPESCWLWNLAMTQTLKTESSCMPYKVKKMLTATAFKSVVWKITQHTRLNNKDFISACPVRPVVDFYLPWQCFHWIYHLFIFIFKSLNVKCNYLIQI